MMRVLILCVLLGAATAAVYTEQELTDYLAGDFETLAQQTCFNYVEANWNYNVDLLNKTKEDAANEQALIFATFMKEQWAEYFRDAEWETFTNELTRRQVQFLSVLGTSALDDASLSEFTGVVNKMTNTYSTAKVCPYTNQACDLETEGMNLDPGVEEVISTSTDYDELAYVWKGWHDASGANVREDYKTYVALSNQAAVANGFADMGEMWRADYESPNFIEDLAQLWSEVEPLYLSLHSYVRTKLVERYGAQMGTDETVMPAHILGNMWAQSWTNLYDFVVPFPDASPVDVTGALNEQNYDALRMFETSDDFYLSLGMFRNDMSYNESLGAQMTKPEDGREVVCHASAWDFCNRETFRIKMCTKVNSEDFITIHHEMGHIQYYLQYKDQPIALRTGANPGFHEAVGDTIALSVSTPQHLEKIGLLSDYTADYEADINALMSSALEKVAFLPFGYLIDQWRWDVFSGVTPETEWNQHWWELRERIQRVVAPVPRSEADFDPGAKFHVPADSQYIAYFVAHILQYQFHKSACIAAGQYDPEDINKPLYKCDIYESVEAGNRLANGLKLGASKHWSEVLFEMTGERELDGSALLEFYAPLKEYLDQQNQKK